LALEYRRCRESWEERLAAAPVFRSFDVLERRDEVRAIEVYRRKEEELDKRKRAERLEKRERQVELRLSLDRQVLEKQQRLIYDKNLDKVYRQQMAVRLARAESRGLSRLRSMRELEVLQRRQRERDWRLGRK